MSSIRRIWLMACLPAVLAFILPFSSPVQAAQSSAPAAGATQAPAPSPAPAVIPWPNRLNTVLPAWIRVRADFRERMEGVDNAGFVQSRDDLYWLTRLRLNTTVAASKQLSFQVQLQDARVGRKTVGSTAAPFKATLDVRTAFSDIGAATGRATMRVGRQELALGDQRLVGHANWLNAARTFDAARLTLRQKTYIVDAFAASVVRILPDAWDKSGNGNRFYGAYVSLRSVLPKGSIDPYFFWRGDRRLKSEQGEIGDLHQATTGVRVAGTLPHAYEYNAEAAVQAGSLGPDTIRAWAGHVQMKTGPFGPALRVAGEYNVASGDADPADGRRGTFDQLYPTAHDKYGLADQVGWRNVQHVRAGVDIARLKSWPIAAAYHSWWLNDARDGLYLASGAQLARIPTGAPGRHVGQEIDVQVTHALTPQLQLAGGYAWIVPGTFLNAATPGATFSAPFVMLSYVFLAEK